MLYLLYVQVSNIIEGKKKTWKREERIRKKRDSQFEGWLGENRIGRGEREGNLGGTKGSSYKKGGQVQNVRKEEMESIRQRNERGKEKRGRQRKRKEVGASQWFRRF